MPCKRRVNANSQEDAKPRAAIWRKECHQVPKWCLAFSSLNKFSSPIIQIVCVPGCPHLQPGAGVLHSVPRSFPLLVWGPAGGHWSSLSGCSSGFPHSGNPVACRYCVYPAIFSPHAVRIWPWSFHKDHATDQRAALRIGTAYMSPV